jgi:peptidoglycan/xylan/chitin deacetylase (PgdA/CDA1 family)
MGGRCWRWQTRGWDIQCHTNTHPDLATLTGTQVREQFEAVDAAFAANGLPRATCHAYPYGSFTQSVRDIMFEYRSMARSVNINLDTFSPAHGA